MNDEMDYEVNDEEKVEKYGSNENINKNNDVLFISLGQQCGVSYNLEKYGWKGETLPFDWIRTPNFSYVVKLIETRFKDFLNPELLEYNNKEEVKFYFKNKMTKCEFVHECEDNNFSDILSKYQRRIDRFYEKIKTFNKIIFIRDIYRHNYSKNYIDSASLIDFDLIIKKINPNLKYRFVIIYRSSIIPYKIITSMKTEVSPNIIFIQDNTYERYWKREQIDWKRIFDNALKEFVEDIPLSNSNSISISKSFHIHV